MQVLVTGGAGFIGSAVCRLLVGEVGAEVLNLDKLTYAADLRTLDALTNAQLQVFGYDSANRVVSITDRDANVTTVQRDSQGNAIAIVSPYGQQTILSIDSDGYLHTVTNPNSELVQLSYKPPVVGDPHTGGLLTQYTNGRGGNSVYEYDPEKKSFRQLVDLRKLLNLPDGHYSPGKIHGRLDLGDDGWLYCSTHRGSTTVTTDKYHYQGDWIVRVRPGTGQAEVVARGPVGKHCIPNSVLDPDRLIFYGGTAPGAGKDDLNGVMFFA